MTPPSLSPNPLNYRWMPLLPAGWGPLPKIALLGVLTLAGGCEDSSMPSFLRTDPVGPESAAELAPLQSTEIVAQGVLQPAAGVLSILAPPGDRVAKIEVATGDHVKPGDVLVELESLRAKEIELEVAQTQLDEASNRIVAEKKSGLAKLQVAELKLRQAKVKLQFAERNFESAQKSGGQLALLKQAADLAQRKLNKLREASGDPSTPRLVSNNRLEEESLKISETRIQYENARDEASQLIQTSQLAVEAASQEIEAAKMTMEAAEIASSLKSLKQRIELLKIKVSTGKLLSPVDGTILRIDAIEGQATATMPLMHVANTSEMVCIAEVNVADLPRLQPGQTVAIRSPALTKEVNGKVKHIRQMIAKPALPSPFPMAPVDRHTVDVIIAIDDADVGDATQRINLQVNVTIQTS